MSAFTEAAEYMKSTNGGHLLAGMVSFRERMDNAMSRDHLSMGLDSYEDWAEDHSYEIERYNIIYDGMSKLFAPKES